MRVLAVLGLMFAAFVFKDRPGDAARLIAVLAVGAGGAWLVAKGAKRVTRK